MADEKTGVIPISQLDELLCVGEEEELVLALYGQIRRTQRELDEERVGRRYAEEQQLALAERLRRCERDREMAEISASMREAVLRRDVQLREKVMDCTDRGIDIWYGSGTLLVRNELGARLTNITKDEISYGLASVSEAHELLDEHSEPVDVEQLPVMRALRGEHVFNETMTVNGRHLCISAYPLQLDGVPFAIIIYYEVTP